MRHLRFAAVLVWFWACFYVWKWSWDLRWLALHRRCIGPVNHALQLVKRRA